MRITKTDGVATYIPGTSTTYTIVVSNVGPSNVTGATVTDTFPASITSATWTCVTSGGATCAAASGSGNINHTVNIPVGGTLTYTVTVTIASSATGNLVNTALVTPPATVTDSTPANNTATDTDTPIFNVDLQITKTDATTTYSPGASTTYTIVVSNSGPSNATGATVADAFPAQVTGATWTCVAAGGATCTASGTGNINNIVNIPVGGTLTYTATVTISSAATGNMVNTATVTEPAGYNETAPGNNSATDTDTAVSSADLSITKTSPVTTYDSGSTIAYTIVVTNNGPNNVTGATLNDAKPGSVTTWGWCVAPCTPAANTGAALSAIINIAAGNSITYNVIANLNPGANGSIVNTATIAAPAGATDPTPGNNSATFTHVPYIDLQITKTDGSATYVAGGSVTYSVTVTNNSTFNLNGITVTDPIPGLVTTWGWCVTPCAPAANTSANLSDTINLSAGSSISYSILANIHASAAGNLDNTATVTVPAGYVEATPGDNSATDTDINQTGEPDVGPPDGNLLMISDGGSFTFYLNKPINADGLPTADFVYYERANGANVNLDQIMIEISQDGVTWLPVFFWGNGPADNNSNVSGFCPGTEDDNCAIPLTSLYNNTGVAIDVDGTLLSSVAPGNYNWIRFSEPGLGSTDGAHVDSIEILH